MKPPLFIGRFQPFHLGHLDAVKQILRHHRKIIIAIGSAQYQNLPKNPFSAAVRKKMILVTLRAAGISQKKITIVKIPDIHNDKTWVKYVERLAPKFGTVYSGNIKVQKLFKEDGTHPVRTPHFNIKISGTEIRLRLRAH